VSSNSAAPFAPLTVQRTIAVLESAPVVNVTRWLQSFFDGTPARPSTKSRPSPLSVFTHPVKK
jgi:hypothetical protein